MTLVDFIDLICPIDLVPVEILSVVMPDMSDFASLSIREISKAVLSFYKCALTVFQPINMGPFISSMVSASVDKSYGTNGLVARLLPSVK